MSEIIIRPGKDNRPRENMEEQIVFILHKAGVDGPEIDECILWAFGPNAWYVPISPDWIDRWNKLHPRACQVKKEDKFREWIAVVGKIFCHIKEHGDNTGPIIK